MSKYEVMFCECGRIHITNRSDIDWMKEDMKNRKVYHVCTNCGSTYVQYLDDYLDGFCLCGADVRDEVLTSNENYKIYIDNGIKVPLQYGGYADTYFDNTYSNMYDLNHRYLIYNSYSDDVRKKYPKYFKVDIKRLIKEVDDSEIIEAIKNYASGIDWED